MARTPPPAAHEPTMLKQWRRHRGLSQEALGEMVGMKHTTIGRLEKGQTAYIQDTIEKLAHALDCSPMELLFIDPEKPGEYLQALLKKDVMRAELVNMLSNVASRLQA
jgi:transcriptional regulator with XRE-family HTH domain